jgi:GNAT superfamily N-acetyltransferase
MTAMEWSRDGFRITTDPAQIDRAAAHAYLTRSYWAEEVPREIVDRSIDNSLAFAVFEADKQVGFARVITDRATFAYVADVYVLEEYRGRGLARWLMETIGAHPDLQGLRRWILTTRDAHGLYRKVGFVPVARTERFMEIDRPGLYRKPRGE